MHSVILLTAMTATTGLFGGGRHGHHMAYTTAPCNTCGGGAYSTTGATAPVSYQGGYTSGSPTYPQVQQPAPPMTYQPAPQTYPTYQQPTYQQANRRPFAMSSFYHPAASTCPGGNCPRR